MVKAKQMKDLGPPEDVEYIERERHAVAVHEACHAVTAFRVRRHLTIDIATIEKGGTYLGMVASIPPEDQFTRWRTEYEADVMVSLASLAGERLFFEGDNSSGVSGDLESATQIATLMEGYWGMGTTVTSHGVTQQVGIGGGGRPGKGGGGKKTSESDLLHGGLGDRIEEKLSELLERVELLLVLNRTSVLAVAHALETHKTVTGDDIEAIIECRQGPLIDGRVYGDPDFSRVVEEYHAQAIAAHNGHGDFEIPLPVLGNGSTNGYTPGAVQRQWARPAARTSVTEARRESEGTTQERPSSSNGAREETRAQPLTADNVAELVRAELEVRAAQERAAEDRAARERTERAKKNGKNTTPKNRSDSGKPKKKGKGKGTGKKGHPGG